MWISCRMRMTIMMMIKWTLITMDIELSKWRMRTRKVAKWTVVSLKISRMMKVSMMRNKILKNKLKFDWVWNMKIKHEFNRTSKKICIKGNLSISINCRFTQTWFTFISFVYSLFILHKSNILLSKNLVWSLSQSIFKIADYKNKSKVSFKKCILITKWINFLFTALKSSKKFSRQGFRLSSIELRKQNALTYILKYLLR